MRKDDVDLVFHLFSASLAGRQIETSIDWQRHNPENIVRIA